MKLNNSERKNGIFCRFLILYTIQVLLRITGKNMHIISDFATENTKNNNLCF